VIVRQNQTNRERKILSVKKIKWVCYKKIEREKGGGSRGEGEGKENHHRQMANYESKHASIKQQEEVCWVVIKLFFPQNFFVGSFIVIDIRADEVYWFACFFYILLCRSSVSWNSPLNNRLFVLEMTMYMCLHISLLLLFVSPFNRYFFIRHILILTSSSSPPPGKLISSFLSRIPNYSMSARQCFSMKFEAKRKRSSKFFFPSSA